MTEYVRVSANRHRLCILRPGVIDILTILLLLKHPMSCVAADMVRSVGVFRIISESSPHTGLMIWVDLRHRVRLMIIYIDCGDLYDSGQSVLA